MSKSHKAELCRCCKSELELFSSARVLTYKADYYQCTNCGSLQIENPHWIGEAHSAAISDLDTGLVARCLSASRLIGVFLFLQGRNKWTGIDWGGGTGLLTRLLRDQGYDVLSYDKYIDGQHSKGFNITSNAVNFSKDFLIAIECFEHLEDPIGLLLDAVAKKDYFIFTTEIINSPPPDPAKGEWWYFMPESGQHITFASKAGLTAFSKHLGFNFLTSFGSLHIMSRKRIKFKTRSLLKVRPFRQLLILIVPELLSKRQSLTLLDKEFLSKKL
jgi:hypothetical protein